MHWHIPFRLGTRSLALARPLPPLRLSLRMNLRPRESESQDSDCDSDEAYSGRGMPSGWCQPPGLRMIIMVVSFQLCRRLASPIRVRQLCVLLLWIPISDSFSSHQLVRINELPFMVKNIDRIPNLKPFPQSRRAFPAMCATSTATSGIHAIPNTT